MVSAALVAFAALASGCISSSERYVDRFASGKLTGMVKGKEWKYRYAFIDPTSDTGQDSDYMFVFLPFKPKDRCPLDSEIPPDAITVQVAAPKVKKTTKLKNGSPRVLGFISPGKRKNSAPDLKVAKKGHFQLTKISSSKVKGKLRGKYNSKYWVNGTFKATVCSIAEMER